MLKLCCDCIAGSNRDTENTYNTTISENFPIVQWTSRTPGNMFRLPRPLKMYDSIEIKGEVQRRESIMFSLCLENNCRVHKIEVNFLDRCIYKYTDDGEKQKISNDDPADIITESSFTLALKVDRQDDDGKYIIGLSIDSFDFHDFSEYNISNISGFEISDVKVTKLCFNY
ncbi:uncharacterized protein LOC121726884 [Aricia agestis]|uniref:uncharacterized protein LOC121726884 n=1 Tax=Aricia agestis TaxID=91739 RepID=UPI001C204538|nr:uncharacterized protein LOC121726884 [Aricia agestis]